MSDVHRVWARLFALVHSPPRRNRIFVARLSSGCSAIELQAVSPTLSCPVQESNLALRCFRPTLVTTRASGAKAGKVDCFPAAVNSSSIFRERERSDRSRGSAGNRTPFARLRAECFAIKASDPHVRLLPPVGLEPTHAGLKGRYPTSWVTAAHVCRRLVCECGSGRTRTCDGRWAQTGLQPASFAARMHAPPTRSRNSFPIA